MVENGTDVGARRFVEKVAIVTGAGSGIGRATALAFGAEGAQVVVSDVDGETAARTAAAIVAAGGQATAVKADVAIEADVVAMIETTLATYGTIDCAFNNAGIGGGRKPLHEWESDDFLKVLGVNLMGVWHCMKHELPTMLKHGTGAIVNSASIAGLRGSPTIAPYVASKHGVVGLTRVAALEYGPHGVRVNAVCPGWTDTPILRGLKEDSPGLVESLVARVPLQRLGRPEEVAAAVLWLCSDASSFALGQSMVLDGGLTA